MEYYLTEYDTIIKYERVEYENLVKNSIELMSLLYEYDSSGRYLAK